MVARIYDPRRALIYQRLGIPTVATVSWTVDQVARRLLPEEAVTAWTDPLAPSTWWSTCLPEAFCGRATWSWRMRSGSGRSWSPEGGQARLAAPGLVGQEGDVVHFVVRSDAQADLERLLRRRPGRPGPGGVAGGRLGAGRGRGS